MTNEIPTAAAPMRANPVPVWIYWALVVGVSFIAGFSLAAFIFSAQGSSPAAESPAPESPSDTAGAASGASSEAGEASADASDPSERLYTYEEALGLLYESIPLTAPAEAPFPNIHRTEDGDPAFGAEDAAVTIVEYSDFSCGFCRRFFNETLPQITEAYGDKVRFVYRDFPILGEGSSKAAVAAECADEQGRFWEYHNYLFTNPGTFHDLGLSAIAYRLGMDLDAFQACLASQDMVPEIQADFDAARNLNVTGTPSFTINGELIVGAQPFEKFKEIIDAKLAAAQ